MFLFFAIMRPPVTLLMPKRACKSRHCSRDKNLSGPTIIFSEEDRMNQVLQASEIQQLLSCEANDLEKVAEANGIPHAHARGARLYWRRRMLGKCQLCGKLSEKGRCGGCKKRSSGQPLDSRSPVGLLKQMKSTDVLLRQRCLKCAGSIDQTVGFVLSMFEKFGSFRASHVCKACKTAKQREPLRQRPFETLRR